MSQKPEKHLPFRPLDNSMSTQTKYELELEHWDRARKSIDNTKSDPGIGGVVTLFGGLFQIFGGILQIIFFIFAGFIDLYKRWKEDKNAEREHQRYMERLDKIIANAEKPKGWDTPDSEYEKED